MALASLIPDGDLAKLRRLAGALSAADQPELDALDEIANLAADIATRLRAGMRQQMIDRLVASVQVIFPAADDDLSARLADAPHEELQRLAELSDQTIAAQAGLTEADTELMAAHDRGDYAAMAPLALEADRQRTAFTAATTELADRIGLPGALSADLASAPATTKSPRPSDELAAPPANGPDATSAGAEIAAASEQPAVVAIAEPTEAGVNSAADPESPGDRRRLRSLLRQMRDTPNG